MSFYIIQKLVNLDEDLSGVEDDHSSMITASHGTRPISPPSYSLDSPIKFIELGKLI